MLSVFSHSRLSSFEKCPKQFHFRYVLHIPAESESVEAFLGKRVHEVVELPPVLIDLCVTSYLLAGTEFITIAQYKLVSHDE